MIKPNLFKNILPATLIVAGFFSSPVNAKSIKDLTSNKTAKSNKSKVDEVAQLTGAATKYHAVGVGIGQTFLAGDFSDTGDDSITADLFYEYSASHSFDFIANFHYSKHDFRTTSTTVSGLALGIKAKLFNFDSFSPFALGGLGFYGPRMERDFDGTVVKSDSKIVFGYHAGVGAELDLNHRVKVGFMGTMHNPFDVRQETQPEVEGAYYKLLLTIFYKFY